MSSLFESLNFPSTSQLHLQASPSQPQANGSTPITPSQQQQQAARKRKQQQQQQQRLQQEACGPKVYWKNDVESVLLIPDSVALSPNKKGKARAIDDDIDAENRQWWLRPNSEDEETDMVAVAAKKSATLLPRKGRSVRSLSKTASASSNASSSGSYAASPATTLTARRLQSFRRHASSSSAFDSGGKRGSGVGIRAGGTSSGVQRLLADLSIHLQREDSLAEEDEAGLLGIVGASRDAATPSSRSKIQPTDSNATTSSPRFPESRKTSMAQTPAKAVTSSWERTATFPPSGSPATREVGPPGTGHREPNDISATHAAAADPLLTEDLLKGVDFDADLSFDMDAEEDQMVSDLVLSQMPTPHTNSGTAFAAGEETVADQSDRAAPSTVLGVPLSSTSEASRSSRLRTDVKKPHAVAPPERMKQEDAPISLQRLQPERESPRQTTTGHKLPAPEPRPVAGPNSSSSGSSDTQTRRGRLLGRAASASVSPTKKRQRTSATNLTSGLRNSHAPALPSPSSTQGHATLSTCRRAGLTRPSSHGTSQLLHSTLRTTSRNGASTINRSQSTPQATSVISRHTPSDDSAQRQADGQVATTMSSDDEFDDVAVGAAEEIDKVMAACGY